MEKRGRKRRPLNADGTLTCCDCKEDKPLEEFYADKSKTHGVQAYCKKCNHIRAKGRYKNRKEKIYNVNIDWASKPHSIHWGREYNKPNWEVEFVKRLNEEAEKESKELQRQMIVGMGGKFYDFSDVLIYGNEIKEMKLEKIETKGLEGLISHGYILPDHYKVLPDKIENTKLDSQDSPSEGREE